MRSASANTFPKQTFYERLFQPVSNSPLIAFRMLFGFLMAYHFLRSIFNGAIYENYIKPPFTFNYIGFDFLQPLPGNGMYFYAGIMVVLAILIMLGAWYRFAMITFTVMWTAMYLMQKADYNNHYYLMVLLCLLMSFMPAHRYFSVDSKRNAVKITNTCPQFYLWIFMLQIGIVYFFAATSKITSDWFSGKYIEIQFSGFTGRFLTGGLYAQRWFQLCICYGGFLFDLLIIPLLLWKPAKTFAFFLACLFHLFNSYTFSIGIFPYLSIALNLFFLDPGIVHRFFFSRQKPVIEDNVQMKHHSIKSKLLIAGFSIYLIFQLLVPLRSFFYHGNVFWTEEGYRLSWKMMLRTKSGKVHFKVIDPVSNKTWIADPAKLFIPKQVMWLAISPDIIWQYAQRLKKEFAEKGFPNVQVYAIGSVSLNRSKPMPLVDSSINLAGVKWEAFRHSKWITEHE
ncbi:MAG: HTTM domain-containing protein [Ferruginibacter sp.]